MTKPEPEPAALLLFDDGKARLGPLDDLRPVFALRSGVFSNRQRIEAALGRSATHFFVAERVAALTRQEHANTSINTRAESSSVLAVNSRWMADDVSVAEQVRELELGETIVTQAGEVLAACVTSDGFLQAWDQGASLEDLKSDAITADAVLLESPWDLLNGLDARIARDLDSIQLPVMSALPHGVTRVGPHPILVHADTTISPHVHLDTTLGPIALDERCNVQPFSLIEGPCYLGPDAVIAPHTSLRTGCVIGQACKVGGEVKASILDNFTNKAHYGYLGNAIVGRWCNLGAGTTASNLKNTWGEVRMQLNAHTEPETTGRTFLGPVIGDFVRTAIGTTLPTGSVVGTAACVVASGFPPKYVPAMTFLTDAGPQCTDLPALMRTLERMMQRRNQVPSEVLRQRLEQLSHA